MMSTAASSPIFKDVPQEGAWAWGAGNGEGVPPQNESQGLLFGASVPQLFCSYGEENILSQTGGGGERFPGLRQAYSSFVRAALQPSLPGDPGKLVAFRLTPIKSHLD